MRQKTIKIAQNQVNCSKERKIKHARPTSSSTLIRNSKSCRFRLRTGTKQRPSSFERQPRIQATSSHTPWLHFRTSRRSVRSLHPRWGNPKQQRCCESKRRLKKQKYCKPKHKPAKQLYYKPEHKLANQRRGKSKQKPPKECYKARQQLSRGHQKVRLISDSAPSSPSHTGKPNHTKPQSAAKVLFRGINTKIGRQYQAIRNHPAANCTKIGTPFWADSGRTQAKSRKRAGLASSTMHNRRSKRGKVSTNIHNRKPSARGPEYFRASNGDRSINWHI